MNLYILIALLICMIGCAPTIPRTGTVSLSKFSVEPTTNRNPVVINNEAVENIRSALESHIINEMKDDSKLVPVSGGCANAEYELTGVIKELNSDLDSHFRLVTVKVNHRYTVDVEGQLIDCKTKSVVVDFDASKEKDEVMEAVESLAQKVVDKIKKVPAPPAPMK